MYWTLVYVGAASRSAEDVARLIHKRSEGGIDIEMGVGEANVLGRAPRYVE